MLLLVCLVAMSSVAAPLIPELLETAGHLAQGYKHYQYRKAARNIASALQGSNREISANGVTQPNATSAQSSAVQNCSSSAANVLHSITPLRMLTALMVLTLALTLLY